MQLSSANIFRVSTINNTPPDQSKDFNFAVIGENNSLYVVKNVDENNTQYAYGDKLNNIIKTIQF